MSSSPDPNRDSDFRPVSPRIQFRLASMLGFLTISALLFGISKQLGIGYGIATFATAFLLFIALICGLISVLRKTTMVVFEGKTNAEAYLCRDYLRENGVRAAVLEGNTYDTPGWTIRPPQVLAPVEQAEKARELLAQLAAWDEEKPEEPQ